MMAKPIPRVADPDPPPLTEADREVLERAQAGDPTALGPVRELLAARPELWRQMGDLCGHAEDSLLAVLAGKSLLARESIRQRLAELKDEHLGPAPSPAERLAVDRVAVTWLQVYLADLDAAQGERAGGPQGAHLLRRQAAAQARHLAALKQLGVLRKLTRPAPKSFRLLPFPGVEGSGPDSGDERRPGA
ncbi:MAG: hypothetical protein JWO38_1896 [Gemmataceae bacterium]|nr:hypothetical protein [Gemmataceae bacterium]